MQNKSENSKQNSACYVSKYTRSSSQQLLKSRQSVKVHFSSVICFIASYQKAEKSAVGP